MPGFDEDKSDPVEAKKAPSGEATNDKNSGEEDAAKTSSTKTKEGDEEPPPAPADASSTMPAANDPSMDELSRREKEQEKDKKDEEEKKEGSTTNPTEAAAPTSTADAAETVVLAAAKASADAKATSAKPAAKKKASATNKRVGRASLLGKSSGDTAQAELLKAAASKLPPLDVNYEELTADSYFTTTDMRVDVADSFFVAIAQMRPCGLTQDDRVGKYRQREIGFVGMCCRHCGGHPGFGRYFPGSCKCL